MPQGNSFNQSEEYLHWEMTAHYHYRLISTVICHMLFHEGYVVVLVNKMCAFLGNVNSNSLYLQSPNQISK